MFFSDDNFKTMRIYNTIYNLFIYNFTKIEPRNKIQEQRTNAQEHGTRNTELINLYRIINQKHGTRNTEHGTFRSQPVKYIETFLPFSISRQIINMSGLSDIYKLTSPLHGIKFLLLNP